MVIIQLRLAVYVQGLHRGASVQLSPVMVFDDFCLDQEYDVLTNIGTEVGDPFQIPGNIQQV